MNTRAGGGLPGVDGRASRRLRKDSVLACSWSDRGPADGCCRVPRFLSHTERGEPPVMARVLRKPYARERWPRRRYAVLHDPGGGRNRCRQPACQRAGRPFRLPAQARAVLLAPLAQGRQGPRRPPAGPQHPPAGHARRPRRVAAGSLRGGPPFAADVQALAGAAAGAGRAGAQTGPPGWGSTAPVSTGGGYAIPREIVMCESGGDYNAVNPSSGAYGAYQIMPSTSAALRLRHEQSGRAGSVRGQGVGGAGPRRLGVLERRRTLAKVEGQALR